MRSPSRVPAVRFFLFVCVGVMAGLSSAATTSRPAGGAAGSWELAGALSAPREGASATLLLDGRVLVSGGDEDSSAIPTAEIVDASGLGFAASPMRAARAGHTATLLADGRVLVTGGRNENGTAESSAEIFDPAAGTWSEVPGGMTEARSNHVAVALPDGTVLLAGGADGGYVSDSLEIFDPIPGVFSPLAAHLLSPRRDMAASLLDDGRVLFVGGSDAQGALDTLELLDVRTGLVQSGPTLSSPRAGHSLVRLLDGRLLIAGGSDGRHVSSSVELYEPATGILSLASSRLGTARAGHLALRLPDNNAVLFVGGRASGKAVATAEIYEPWNDRFRLAASTGTRGGRVSGTPLAWSGSVLVAGGDGETAVSLYHYATVVAAPSQDATADPITITGSGWEPGERIDILVQDTASRQEFRTSVEADAQGAMQATAPAPAAGPGPSSYLITASGSNDEAQTTILLAASPTRIKVNSMGPGSGTCGTTIVVTARLEGKTGPGTFVPLPNETIDFTLGSATGSGVTDANGVATASLTVPQGATSLDAAYAGNGAYNPTSATIPFTVNGSCCTALTVNTQPAGANKVFGEPASFSVAVTGTAPIAYQWRKDGVTIPSATAASYAIPSVQMGDTGSYDVVITDACATTNSNPAALVVNNASPSVTVASSSNPSVYGDALSFTASVGIAPPGAGAATGTVQFQIDGSDVGTPVPVVSGAATSALVSALTAGLHVVTAVYSGDSNVQGGFASASPDQTVGQASISVTAADDTRVYGAVNPTLSGSLSGVVNGDNITATYATAATQASTVGSYSIVPTLVDPDGKLTNYSVSSTNGTLDVTAASLSVTATNDARVYGAVNPTLSGSLSGVVNGDNITATYATAATQASTVGSYSIVPTLVDPDGKLSNYSVSSTNGTLDVTAASLSVSASNDARVYGAANPALSGSLSGVANGDNITATYATAATQASTVGSYAIVPTLVDPGGKLTNYSVSATNGTLNVTAAPLSVTAANDARVYGAVNPALSGSLSGVVNGDNITATYATAATQASTVGSYAIVPTLVDPDGKLSNYSVSATNGTLNVTAAPLTVTATDASRMFGLPNPAFTGTITGVQNGDNITATYASTATPLSPLGTYAIVPTLVDPGSRLSNYSTSTVNGTLTVVPAGFMIIDPLAGATLDCSAAPPTIVWTPGAYDKFRVYMSWLTSFGKKVTSGDKMLRTTSWTVPAKQWGTVCTGAATSIYIKVLGVDVDVRKKDPTRKAYAAVTAGVQ